jgi:hypothetical protein
MREPDEVWVVPLRWELMAVGLDRFDLDAQPCSGRKAHPCENVR